MNNKLKPVQCKNCKHWKRDKRYTYEGICSKDKGVTTEWTVCNLLRIK